MGLIAHLQQNPNYGLKNNEQKILLMRERTIYGRNGTFPPPTYEKLVADVKGKGPGCAQSVGRLYSRQHIK